MTTVMTPVVAAQPVPPGAPPARSARARQAWTGVGLVLALALVGVFAFNIVGTVADQALPSQHRVFTAPVTTVTVEVDNGSVTIERSAGPGTSVDSSGTRGVTTPTDVERLTGGTLAIRSSCGSTLLNNHCTRHYVLRVEPNVSLHISSQQGNVNVSGVDGSLVLHSDEGDVTVTGGTGALRASTQQGNVSASGRGGQPVSAHSGQGDVALGFVTPPTQVTASSDQGNVIVAVPKGSGPYQVHSSSEQGNVSTTVAEDTASRRVIRASSAQGDVTVSYGAG
jgi:hypothetical protein